MSEQTMTTDAAAALREPFPPEQIGKLPKAGLQLDYVGHAAVTDRLLQVDPLWTWEPAGVTPEGAPHIVVTGTSAALWIRLTVCGVTRLGVGIENANSADLEKKLIGDALRNAAMRFGVALDLWQKHDAATTQPPAKKAKRAPSTGQVEQVNCPLCEESLFNGSPVVKVDGGRVHKSCADELAVG